MNIDDIFKDESAKSVFATDTNGKKIQLTKVEASAHQIVNAALRDDDKAIAVVLGLATKLKDVGAFDEPLVVVLRKVFANGP